MRRLHYDPAPLAHVVDDFEGDTSERLAGCELPAVADPDPDDEPLVYLNAFSVRRRPPKDCIDTTLLCIYNGNPHQPLLWVKAGKYWHAARLETDRKRLFFRAAGCVRAERNKDGFQFYARVYHLRKWVLLLPFALAALLLCLSLAFFGSGSSSSSGSLGFLDGAKSSGGSAAPVVSIRYASYDSGDNEVTWKSQALKQPLKLSLPANCTHGGETGCNPVASSPSVYVDSDNSGTFDDSECVWNAPDSSGYGKLLAAGSEVDSIELSKQIPPGQYLAMTVWRSVLSSDHSQPAGQSAFTWRLTVE